MLANFPPVNYILTAGTSVLSNITIGAGLEGASAPKMGSDEQLRERIKELLERPEDPQVRSILDDYLDRAAAVKAFVDEAVDLHRDWDPLPRIEPALSTLHQRCRLNGAKLRDLTAEAKAIAAAASDKGSKGADINEVLSPEDEIRLIATDTHAGVASAVLVGWLLAGRVAIRRFGDSKMSEKPGQIDGIGRQGAALAEVVVVAGLQVESFGVFEQSLKPLGEALARSVRRSDQANQVLLSGGFKAVPPVVTACCEFLDDIDGIEVDVGINFESSEQLLQIPLRRVPPRWQEALRAKSPTHPLAGWAYVGQTYTGFGLALDGLLAGSIGEV